MKRFNISSISFVLLFLSANLAIAQPTILTRILAPARNYEVALGDTVTPIARVINNGPVPINELTIYYRIQNPVSGISPYFDSIILPSIPPGDTIDEAFAAYVTSPDSIRQLGMFNGTLIAQTDTVSSLLFGLRRASAPFFDPSDNYGKTKPHELTSSSIDVPDQTLWESVGATVVDGESSTWDPPPPRYPGRGVGSDGMISPVLRLDRSDYNGNFYAGTGVGDTLTSFPINLAGAPSVYFYFDYMRAGRQQYPLGWDDSSMFGPENTILNVNTGQVVRAGDSLLLEFRDPSQSPLNVSPNGWNEIAAFDGGHDFEFKRFSARGDSTSWQITMNGVTKTLMNTPNYLDANFRFRFRLKANNDAPKTPIPVDDADQWYIDNPLLGLPFVPEHELRWVRVVNPYTKVPVTQAVFPIFVSLGSIDYPWATGVPLLADIIDPKGDTVYSQTLNISSQNLIDTVIQFPNWDATGERGSDTGAYTIIAQIAIPNFQNFNTTQTYTKFYLHTETNPQGTQEFALDDAGIEPAIGAGNDMPKLTGIRGTGIGFQNTSGSFAMKFQLVRPDTFYGVRAYFGSANAAPDYIRISLLQGEPGSNTPGDTIEQPGFASTMLAQRGPLFDQFNSYYYPRPIPLKAGMYWVSVSQLSVISMELGGCIARGGGEVVETDPFLISPDINVMYGQSAPGLPSYGTQWGGSPDNNNGDESGSFAVEATAGSGGWAQLMPGQGWWPTMTDVGLPWSEILQFQLNLPNSFTGAGTYVPMIRPIIDPLSPTSSVNATQVPQSLTLEPNYPNPFTPSATSTTINFTLVVESQTLITISNVLGKVVKTLVNANLQAGTYPITWDGRDKNGSIVPAGIYLVSLTSGGQHATEKVIATE